MARAVTGAAVAVAGIAARAYGVPVPELLGAIGDQGATLDTIDYSKMTAEERMAKERNRSLRAAIEGLRTYAVTQVGTLDENNAREIHRQLRRRLSGVVAGM